MAKVTTQIDLIPVPGREQTNVYCKACPRHCYLYTLAVVNPPIDRWTIVNPLLQQIENGGVCPLPNV